ncbi:pyruvate, phosphate dikinase [Longimycelium tulufanense]|uniref:Pyruvate, phosphate dikinase n=1 Tax=Longimycelium tulufanense TaxID=907463 RepID=A0A8J3CDU6_9PSEU|nr:pyruvate, phosphate dikinase [Longimycelium tulufanense]GGM59785.1 pyruvate, phosphate dikinase [Longimycelium tulufanense]
MATTWVYDFAEGHKDLADLLGGKGANLAEMSRLGLPVPPGFIITTEACRAYLSTGYPPEQLWPQLREHLAGLEQRMGRRLGAATDPLLVSVRSGARFSMPGMMETVLNIGVNDASVQGLAHRYGERLAWDCYRRLVHMFGTTVLGVPNEPFAAALDATGAGESDVTTLRGLVRTYQDLVRRHSGRDFPQDPWEQLQLAVRAVFDSWRAPRAVLYRRQERIPDDQGTAVSVVAMVFGNAGPDSGTGVAFTRDPATGARGVYGDYLPNAQGEDVVAGVRTPVPLHELADRDPRSYRQLLDAMTTLERHYRDLCDIEFTIERCELWILQTRVGKRTAAAAFVVAAQLAEEGVIDRDEALTRVSGAQLGQLMFPRFDPGPDRRRLATGINASPGAAVGRAVFDSARAAELASAGERVVLVRRETNPDDLPGMVAAQGVLTSRGGKTSHAAVVARGMGKPCVCGADALEVDAAARRAVAAGDVVVPEGDVISVDGSTGAVYLGEVPVVPSAVAEYFERGGRPEGDGDELVCAVDILVRHADRVRGLGVRANADTPADAARARRMGAEGIGLCRTEHMFLGPRRKHVERLVLADNDTERESALAELLPQQREDFVAILREMDGLPVTIRLLDPPLHEFLPDLADLTARVAVARTRGEDATEDERVLRAVRRLHEHNPMLGLRGVRLGLVLPGLYTMQARAIAEATADRIAAGADPRPQIMVPLVADATELALTRREIAGVLAEVAGRTGRDLHIPIGTMIEVPRAAVTADRIARHADFFSLGTNDLTQLVWGFSRDDVEAEFFARYLELDVFADSPFETLDRTGVGELVRAAVRGGRSARPDLEIGVCGEHGGDPASVGFFAGAGLDYVSCSPFRVPVARLAAGRAAVAGRAAPSDESV